MNILLVFFAIPVATIILSVILETLINCPLKVGGIFFSIFIVVAAALGGTVELFFAAIIYTIISFITAFIVCCISKRYNHFLKYTNESTNNTINSLSNALTEGYEENCDCIKNENMQNSENISNNYVIKNSNPKTDYYIKRYR